MKYLVIICNGLTDQAIAEKDNRTPLQLADTPHMDRLAAEGRSGSLDTVPESLEVGGEVSGLSLLGYDPEKYWVSPAQLEAQALDVVVGEGEIPLCCDFIILQASHNDMIMKDFTAGQLASEPARSLVAALNEQIVDETLTFHAGVGHHNLLVIKIPPFDERLKPPNELVGEGIRKHMPTACKDLVYVINQAQIILHHHPYNKARTENGDDPVNSIWLWGNGNGPTKNPPSFFSLFEKRAALISPSLIMQGLARLVGIRTVPVEGATGFLDTNYQGKVDAALNELKSCDVVYLNVAGAETVSLQGNIDDKIQALEDFDAQVLGPILTALENQNDVTLLLTENHISSVDLMRYKRGAVPFVVFPSTHGPDAIQKFDEDIVQSSAQHFKSGPALMETLFKGTL